LPCTLKGPRLEQPRRIHAPLRVKERNVRVIAKRFGVDPGTVQRISRPFAGASVVGE